MAASARCLYVAYSDRFLLIESRISIAYGKAVAVRAAQRDSAFPCLSVNPSALLPRPCLPIEGRYARRIHVHEEARSAEDFAERADAILNKNVDAGACVWRCNKRSRARHEHARGPAEMSEPTDGRCTHMLIPAEDSTGIRGRLAGEKCRARCGQGLIRAKFQAPASGDHGRWSRQKSVSCPFPGSVFARINAFSSYPKRSAMRIATERS